MGLYARNSQRFGRYNRCTERTKTKLKYGGFRRFSAAVNGDEELVNVSACGGRNELRRWLSFARDHTPLS